MRNALYILLGFALATVSIAGMGTVQAALPERPESTTTPTASVSTETPEPTETPRPTATPIVITATPLPAHASFQELPFGWDGKVHCYDCTPFTQRVRLTHYNPQLGDINCWLWDDEFQWCMSNTWSEIPWESVWRFGAACPADWPVGTWLEIPDVGWFICFDHGDQVICNEDRSLCNVDLLGPGGAEWDGKEVDITLWVPLKPRGQ